MLKVKEELEQGAASRDQELKEARQKLAERKRELDKARRREDVSGRMEHVLQSCLKPSEVLAVFTQFAAELFPEQSGAVYIFNVGKRVYESAAFWGRNPPAARKFAWQDCWSLRRQQMHVAAGEAVRCRHVREKTRHICVPLKAAGLVIGVLSVLVPAVPGCASAGKDAVSDAAATAGEAADRLSMALYNLKLRELLKDNSLKDPFSADLK